MEVVAQAQPLLPAVAGAQRFDGLAGSGATDLYLSTVSNRQNDVMKQLTVIATIFLPLSFITGFFGQNFGYLVTDLIRAPWTFWVLGVGSMLATSVGLLRRFQRKGWV